MNLDEAQRKKVTEWIAQGLKLADIQKRLASDLGVTMTYMDVRLVVDDLKLTPKDPEPPKPTPGAAVQPLAEPTPATGSVSVKVDHLARPGSVVSGKVTFSDGQSADWYFDQAGKLGLVPQQTGYRPPAADLQQFQTALDAELSKMGF